MHKSWSKKSIHYHKKPLQMISLANVYGKTGDTNLERPFWSSLQYRIWKHFMKVQNPICDLSDLQQFGSFLFVHRAGRYHRLAAASFQSETDNTSKFLCNVCEATYGLIVVFTRTSNSSVRTVASENTYYKQSTSKVYRPYEMQLMLIIVVVFQAHNKKAII